MPKSGKKKNPLLQRSQSFAGVAGVWAMAFEFQDSPPSRSRGLIGALFLRQTGRHGVKFDIFIIEGDGSVEGMVGRGGVVGFEGGAGIRKKLVENTLRPCQFQTLSVKQDL